MFYKQQLISNGNWTSQNFKNFKQLANLGAYGAHMFALRVWVGDETSKIFLIVLSL